MNFDVSVKTTEDHDHIGKVETKRDMRVVIVVDNVSDIIVNP